MVIQTGTTEYAAETCRGLKRAVETPADCVRTGQATALQTAPRGLFRPLGAQQGHRDHADAVGATVSVGPGIDDDRVKQFRAQVLGQPA
jgi:hypothetical protein